jgi:16S rRNA (guanine966-N2)-methyltransferase
MGAEALCRGADVVIGIEQDRRACGVIQQNWRKLAQDSQQFRVLQMDALKGLASLQGQQFDRIYVDPPYASDLYNSVLEAITTHNLLAAQGELAVESGKHNPLPTQVDQLRIINIRHYGKTKVTFYRGSQELE